MCKNVVKSNANNEDRARETRQLKPLERLMLVISKFKRSRGIGIAEEYREGGRIPRNRG